jgi:hypothetical protein
MAGDRNTTQVKAPIFSIGAFFVAICETYQQFLTCITTTFSTTNIIAKFAARKREKNCRRNLQINFADGNFADQFLQMDFADGIFCHSDFHAAPLFCVTTLTY